MIEILILTFLKSNLYMNDTEFIFCLINVLICTFALLKVTSKLVENKKISPIMAMCYISSPIYLFPITSFIIFYIWAILYFTYKSIGKLFINS